MVGYTPILRLESISLRVLQKRGNRAALSTLCSHEKMRNRRVSTLLSDSKLQRTWLVSGAKDLWSHGGELMENFY